MEASLKKQKPSLGIDLEEIILSVYNEVKNALEHVEKQDEGNTQNEGNFLLNIESLRIKIPLLLPEDCPEIPTFCDNASIYTQVKLLSPKHSAEQNTNKQDRAFTEIQNGMGELEMTFLPVKRTKCT